MSTEIGTISGTIELKDKFTEQIHAAAEAVVEFASEAELSLGVVATAAAGVATAFVLVGAALTAVVVELGEKGAEINDVAATLEHFSGSAKAAEESMTALREGTKGVVGDFELAKSATRLLSAGVKLTAEDFSTLGSAAFVLQNRGLGPTKDMLELVSSAMITGRTRALAMKLGVVDAGDATEAYAKKLGLTVDQLTKTQKAEATRTTILEMLSKAVKEAGTQERDFAEQIEHAKVVVENWVDELAQAVAASPVLTEELAALGEAFTAAFGGEGEEAIKTIVHWINEGAIVTMDFAIAAVEAARVVYTAWEAIKTVILGVETAIVGVVDAIATTLTVLVENAHDLHAVSDETVASFKGFSTSVHEVTVGLAAQTVEAGKAALGHSEFQKKLDAVGGALMAGRDRMIEFNKATDENGKVVNIAAQNAAKLAKLQDDFAEAAKQRQQQEDAAWKVQAKSLEETSKLWEQFFALRTKNEGTSYDASKAAIEAWRNDEVAKLDASDKNWNEHYAAIQAVADEKLKAISGNWSEVAAKSKEALQQIADGFKDTYDKMMYGSLHFSREVLEEQRKKWQDAAAAARGLGADAVQAEGAALVATQKQNEALALQKKRAEEAAAANRALGGSFTYDLSTKEGIDQYRKMNPAAEITWSYEQIIAYIKKGGTLEGLIKSGVINPYAHMGHAAEGADVMVGENGPEVVRLPVGARVYPTGTGPNAPGNMVLNFQVNGTAVQVAQQIKDILWRELKMQKQFSSSLF